MFDHSFEARALIPASAEFGHGVVRAATREIAISRKALRSGFALGPRPMGATITCLGALYDESLALTWAMTSAASMVAPFAASTNATIDWPKRSSGIPTTTAS